MARLAMIATHRLGKEEAQRRLKEKLIFVRGKYAREASDLHEEWKDNILSFRFKAMGMKVAGTMEVEDGEVRLAAQVPLAAVFFKKLIEKNVRAELGKLLS
jgi:putative polyhydroxyalkanoic acid system protein